MKEEFISCNEAAAILNVTPRAVCKLCDAKKLYAIKEGKKWQVAEESVMYYMANKNTKKRLPCPVGVTLYKEVAQECYYVDKTLLVRDVLEEKNKVILFTRPRRFGKTMALDMLQTFFELSDEDTSVYFKDRLIWNCEEEYKQEQGKYPIIYLSLKDNKYKNWENTFEDIKILLHDEAMRHDYLLQSAELNEFDKRFIIGLLERSLSYVDYCRALLTFSRILEKHYRHKVMIMIDEYDTPILQGYLEGFYEEIISFMRVFLSSCLKDNKSLSRSFLTGILRISKENLFSGLNNITVNTILDERYSEYFGFTDGEIKRIVYYYGRLDKLEELKSWYDGYQFGEQEIYNPWSVANYFSNNCKPLAYWANTSENGIIKKILQASGREVVHDLEKLFLDEPITAKVDFNVIYPRLNESKNVLYSFLLLTGYLKIVNCIAENTYELKIPNREIKSVYRNEILSWLYDKAENSIADDLRIAMLKEDYDAITRLLEGYLMATVSFMDTGKEVFYHGLILGLAAAVSDKYYIRSNRESGQGRLDIALEPKEQGTPGIILELKVAKDAAMLEAQSQEALEQIMNLSYMREFKERQISHIIACGIAFCGKSCHTSVKRFNGEENKNV